MNLSENGEKVLVVANDSGGAEVVSSWVRRNPGPRYRFLVDGPARAIFSRKLSKFTNHRRADLGRLVAESDWVLTSTSHPENLERQAIAAAKQCCIRVVTFLDHWVNYPPRFEMADGKLGLPDEIWVGDEYAAALARQHFPSVRSVFVPNPYFEDIREEFAKAAPTRPADGRLQILYVADSMVERPEHAYGQADVMGFTEFTALESFLRSLERMDLPAPLGRVRIRLHPVEPLGKYDGVVAKFAHMPLAISQGCSLIEDCAWADWVVGLFSTAMVVGLLCGRRVFCAIPNSDIPCPVPHREIIRWHGNLASGVA
jgi:hypothetical protein